MSSPELDLLKMLGVLKADGDIPQRNKDYYSMTETLSKHNFLEPCCFKNGDWVTPKEGTAYKGKGEPCLVIAVYEKTQYQIVGYGDPFVLFNMLVARMDFGDGTEVKVYPAESKNFEKYTGLVYGDGGELGALDSAIGLGR